MMLGTTPVPSRLARPIVGAETSGPGGTGGVLAEAAASYDALATQLATQVNAVHATGTTADGTTGHDFFALTAGVPAARGLTVLPTGASTIASGNGTGGALDGSIARAVGRIGLSTGSPDRAWGSIVSTIGATARTEADRSTLTDLAAWRRGEIGWDAIDHGVVLDGPPGTGKTLFAQVFARVEGMDLSALNHVDWRFETFPEYLSALDGRLGLNFGMYVGHSALRRYVMGDACYERASNDAERDQIVALTEEAMRAGAMGWSSSKAPVSSAFWMIPRPPWSE